MRSGLRSIGESIKFKIMDDNSIMPFGKYKGIELANVPAKYLLWLYYEGNLSGQLKKYITDNLDVLKKEVEQ
jgi:uncharacterized protein (DUF3820 family)